MADFPGYQQHYEALKQFFGGLSGGDSVVGRIAISDGVTTSQLAGVRLLSTTPPGTEYALDTFASLLATQPSTGNPMRLGAEQWSVGGLSGAVALQVMTESAVPEQVIVKSTWVWANSAPVNTVVNSNVQFIGRRAKWIWINIWNPSSVTALTVKVQNTFTDNGAVTRQGLILSFGVATSSPVSKLIQLPGGPAGTAQGSLFAPLIQISASNDTVLGVADGFTASFNVTGQDPAT